MVLQRIRRRLFIWAGVVALLGIGGIVGNSWYVRHQAAKHPPLPAGVEADILADEAGYIIKHKLSSGADGEKLVREYVNSPILRTSDRARLWAIAANKYQGERNYTKALEMCDKSMREGVHVLGFAGMRLACAAGSAPWFAAKLELDKMSSPIEELALRTGLVWVKGDLPKVIELTEKVPASEPTSGEESADARIVNESQRDFLSYLRAKALLESGRTEEGLALIRDSVRPLSRSFMGSWADELGLEMERSELMEKAGDYAGALASAREALTMYCEYLHDISWKPRIQECEERIRSLEKRGVRQATKTEKAKP